MPLLLDSPLNPAAAFGVWSIWQPAEPTRFLEHLAQSGLTDNAEPLNRMPDDDETDPSYYAVVDGVAVIGMVGPLMKGSLDAWWYGGTSTVTARRAISSALADSRVKAILLAIDSPGGTVAGTKELADDVAAASQEKPCYAFIQDMGCSAAYWVASQATKCFANDMALVGSIGTYMVVTDWSGTMDQMGAKVHLIKAGEFKGAGVPGTQITDGQIAQWQSLIDGMNEQFVRAAAQGRKMALRNMKTLADGRAHLAADAEFMGLIDGVQSLDETFAMLAKARTPRSRAKASFDFDAGCWMADGAIFSLEPEDAATESSESLTSESPVAETQTENSPMSETETKATELVAGAALVQKPAIASLADLKAACPGAGADFLMSQLEIGATAEAAGKAWTAKLSEMLAAKDTELKALVEKSTKAAAKTPGVDTLGDKSTGAVSTSADPIAEFEAKKAEYLAKYKDAGRAMRMLAAEHGDLHAAYVAAYNAANPFKKRA